MFCSEELTIVENLQFLGQAKNVKKLSLLGQLSYSKDFLSIARCVGRRFRAFLCLGVCVCVCVSECVCVCACARVCVRACLRDTKLTD